MIDAGCVFSGWPSVDSERAVGTSVSDSKAAVVDIFGETIEAILEIIASLAGVGEYVLVQDTKAPSIVA